MNAIYILAGVAIGILACMPIVAFIERTPKAGPPTQVRLIADAHAYEAAMRRASS